MENIFLFITSVAVYWSAWFFYSATSLKGYAKRAVLLALLCLPVNINGNVFTVAGNAVSEKSVYSVLSFYQDAGHNAITILSLLGYQNAGHNAITGIGISLYQNASLDSAMIVGLSGYQNAGNDAGTFIGLSVYLNAGREAFNAIGLSGYQNAGRDAITLVGLSGYQKAVRGTIILGVSLYQRVGDKSRSFGVGEFKN